MNSYAIRGRLINYETDKEIEDGLVITEGSVIAYAGPYQKELIKKSAEIINLNGGTILPGFIDCHTHLTGSATSGESPMRDDNLLGAAYDLGLLLDAGFTAVRDMSGNGFSLSKAVERGYLRGPDIFAGGKILSPTSGHVDVEPWKTKEEYNLTNRDGRMCDGVSDCILAAREQFRHGAKFIKICATGGVSSISDNISDIQFSREEIKAIVEEAARHGAYVAAHCTGDAGMKEAILSGIGSVEHGVMASQETINLMAERNIPLVTTLYVSLNVANFPGLPQEVAKKASYCAEANIKTIEMARKAGITIVLGTDFSNSKNTPYTKNGLEFSAMVQAGMTPLEAIKAGTINAARLIKADGKTGSLLPGKIANVVIVKGNPLQDITCLEDSKNIKYVFKNGQIEKNIVNL